MYEKIKEFKALLDEGLITQEEYEEQKAKLLGFESPKEAAARELAEAIKAEQERARQEAKRKEELQRKIEGERREAEAQRVKEELKAKREAIAAAEEAERLKKKEAHLAKIKEREEKRKQGKACKAAKRMRLKAAFFRHKKVVAGCVVGLAVLVVSAGMLSYALAPDRAFAVYSDDDQSLSFYQGKPPIQGFSYEGKTATAVYDNVESLPLREQNVQNPANQPGWVKDGNSKKRML